MWIAHLTVLVFFLYGCAPLSPSSLTTKRCATQKVFFVVNHGWHTGIVLKRRDLVEALPSLAESFPEGEYLEIGWGDERFYQAQSVTPDLVLQALFWPTASVLHVVVLRGSPQHYFSNSEVLELFVEPAHYRALLAFVSNSFTRLSDNSLIRYGPGLYGKSWFYRAEGNFHLFHTCNTWVAKALEQAGYPLSGRMILTAPGLMSALQRKNDSTQL